MSKLLKPNGILAFTDGAASGNPGPAGWGVIVLCPDGRVRELGGGSPRATNNQMEIQATIEALGAVREMPEAVTVATDSQYVISGATQWIQGWKRRDWKTMEGSPVSNRDLWEELEALLQEPRFKGKVHWEYVAGHSGIPGNERADEIAVAFSRGQRPALYDGPLTAYRISETDLRDTGRRRAAPSKRSKMAALHYLSLVDGVPMRHATWKECEERVKGRAAARFKKVTTPEEEASILSGWGVNAAAFSKRGPSRGGSD